MCNSELGASVQALIAASCATFWWTMPLAIGIFAPSAALRLVVRHAGITWVTGPVSHRRLGDQCEAPAFRALQSQPAAGLVPIAD